MSEAKSLVGAPARQLIATVESLSRRATELLQLPNALRQQAHREIEGIRAEAVQDALGRRPLTDLRTMLPRGTKVGALEAAGYRTIADVVTRGGALTSVNGVGPQTANAVLQAATDIANQVRQVTRVQLSPDNRGPGAVRLLETLAAIRRADTAASSLQNPIDAFLTQSAPLIEAARPGGSRFRMFFSGSAKKSAVHGGLSGLKEMAESGSFMALDRAVAEAEGGIQGQRSSQELWRDFERNAAAYTTLLSTLGGSAGSDSKEAAAGFVPTDLRKRVGVEKLDQSLLKATLRGYQIFGAQYVIHQRNAIIGDEMGLGKTLQALAAMAHLAAKGESKFLVVCPASVQLNWLNEIHRHTKLRGFSLHGAGRDDAKRRWQRSGGVAVTTFGTLATLKLASVPVAMVVVDEAHFIKNPAAARTAAVRSVISTGGRTLLLSGTPMENRVEEFRNLVSYINPVVSKKLRAASALAGAEAFRRAVSPVYLRRNQEDVLQELPDKIEVEDWVEATRSDVMAYREAVQQRNIMRMRSVSAREAKLERILEIVEEAEDDGLKVIAFSYFLDTLTEIQERVPTAFGPLTGAVPPARRQELVDRFTNHLGPALMLSQIAAGGVGLNVQAASVVIIVEPQWTPSIEAQAIARSHRMGQVRKVQVHRLLAKESVDERVRELQQVKSGLFDEFARKSDAKLGDAMAVETGYVARTEADVIEAEARRLGIGR